MKKRKSLILIMVVGMLMLCNMTSFAIRKTVGDLVGVLERCGANGVQAISESMNPNNSSVYVCVTEEYISDIGNIYLSSPGGQVGTKGKIILRYTPPGTFLSAWSDHGHTSEQFSLYI